MQIESLKGELNSLNAMLTVASVHNQNNSDEKKNTSEILDSQEKTANNSTLQYSTPSKPSVSFSISPPQKGSFYSNLIRLVPWLAKC